jgi:hypothetical protein
LLAAAVFSSGCIDRDQAPSEGESAGEPVEDPLGLFVDTAFGFIAAAQQGDGSWAYYRSQTPELASTELRPDLLGTATTLMNLTHTGYEASPAFDQGASYLKGAMTERYAWSLRGPDPASPGSWVEPDAEATSLALLLLSDRMTVEPDEIKKLRALFDGNRLESGLYRTYFAGFHESRGFVPERNVASLGVNLSVLGLFGKLQLERASLVEALRAAVREERYWEKTPYYPSLPLLAFFASNGVEHGAPEAGEFLRKFLADFATVFGTDPSRAAALGSVELAAYIKARSHECLLAQTPCQELDMWVFELAKRRQGDGSWPAAAFRQTDANEDALRAFLERRDFTVERKTGGIGYDVERALASPGTLRYYSGSSAETTSFALKALTFYRELLRRRGNF